MPRCRGDAAVLDGVADVRAIVPQEKRRSRRTGLPRSQARSAVSRRRRDGWSSSKTLWVACWQRASANEAPRSLAQAKEQCVAATVTPSLADSSLAAERQLGASPGGDADAQTQQRCGYVCPRERGSHATRWSSSEARAPGSMLGVPISLRMRQPPCPSSAACNLPASATELGASPWALSSRAPHHRRLGGDAAGSGRRSHTRRAAEPPSRSAVPASRELSELDGAGW